MHVQHPLETACLLFSLELDVAGGYKRQGSFALIVTQNRSQSVSQRVFFFFFFISAVHTVLRVTPTEGSKLL